MATLTKHAGPGLVAVLYTAIALAQGGTDTDVLAAIAVTIWWAVIVGLFVRVWPGSDAPRAAVACGGCLAGLGVLAGLSLIWADDAGRAFGELTRTAAYLGLFVLAVLASPRGSGAAWVKGLAGGLVALTTLALLAGFEPALFGEAARTVAVEVPSAADRLSYPIGYWNGLAACMAPAVVVLVWLAAEAKSRRGRALAAGLLALPLLALALTQSLGGAAAALIGVACLLIASRRRTAIALACLPGLAAGAVLIAIASRREELIGGLIAADPLGSDHLMLAATIVATAAAVVAANALDPRLRELRPPALRVPRGVLAGVVGVLVVAAFVAADPAQRWEDFKDPGALAELPAEGGEPATALASAAGNGRYQWWSAALGAFRSEPLTGIGAGNYELYWNAHNTLPAVVSQAHSLYVETLGELGVPGLLLVLAFLSAAIAAGIGRRSSTRGGVAVWIGVVAAGATSAAGEWTWEIPAATVPTILAAAVLTGPATLRPRWPRPVAEREPRTVAERFGGAPGPRERFGLGVATMLVAFACIWITGVTLLTEVQLSESRSAFDAGQLDEAAQNAQYASAIQPWSAEPRMQLAQVEEARGRLDEARDAAAEGLERAPGDWRPWVVVARIESRDGKPIAAEAALALANELSPVPLPVELPAPG